MGDTRLRLETPMSGGNMGDTTPRIEAATGGRADNAVRAELKDIPRQVEPPRDPEAFIGRVGMALGVLD